MRWFVVALLAACGGDDGKGAGGGTEDSGTAASSITTTPTGDDYDTLSVPVTEGRAGGCLRTYGATDRVRAVDGQLPEGDAPRTVQAWLRTEATVGEQVAVSHGNSAPGRGFYLGTSDGYVMASAGGLSSIDPTAFVADGRWHHVAVTHGEGLAWVWVDGVRHGSLAFDVDTPDGEVVAGNAPVGATAPWDGWLDDVKVYGRVRPDADLMADPDGDALGLLLWWDFEETGVGAGLAVADVSGGGGEAETGGTESTPVLTTCP